jgi:arginine-tRNA-protein transferase
MSTAQKPRVVPTPKALPVLGPLVIVEGECAYFPDEERPTVTAFALPGPLTQQEYRASMGMGMRRSGKLVYRPLCVGCRACQPFRINVSSFTASRSQQRVNKRCADLFTIELLRPRVNAERLNLYARYQAYQHDKDGQSADEESYARFLVDTIADTWELEWRDKSGALVGVGVIDVVDDGVSSVYFYWDPLLESLSMGIYSALWEIDLCKRWGLPHYYLGYIVPGSRTMSYKAQFHGGEVWTGTEWLPVGGRDIADHGVRTALRMAEHRSVAADAENFAVDDGDHHA